MNARYEKYKETYRKYWASYTLPPRYVENKNDNNRFGGNRSIALARDGYRCTECGMTNDEHIETFERGLNVHHIDENGRNKESTNHKLENLITLCVKCHARLHALKNGLGKVKKQ